mmetsp:Transcript_43000/g.106058  ORF Transcript_43000/g.106058 Transcript_43000/m.106058 type:complete len:360 (-) Transcript_43000:299-1378(-)
MAACTVLCATSPSDDATVLTVGTSSISLITGAPARSSSWQASTSAAAATVLGCLPMSSASCEIQSSSPNVYCSICVLTARLSAHSPCSARETRPLAVSDEGRPPTAPPPARSPPAAAARATAAAASKGTGFLAQPTFLSHLSTASSAFQKSCIDFRRERSAMCLSNSCSARVAAAPSVERLEARCRKAPAAASAALGRGALRMRHSPSLQHLSCSLTWLAHLSASRFASSLIASPSCSFSPSLSISILYRSSCLPVPSRLTGTGGATLPSARGWLAAIISAGASCTRSCARCSDWTAGLGSWPRRSAPPAMYEPSPPSARYSARFFCALSAAVSSAKTRDSSSAESTRFGSTTPHARQT